MQTEANCRIRRKIAYKNSNRKLKLIEVKNELNARKKEIGVEVMEESYVSFEHGE
jgi:hypothetical protein